MENAGYVLWILSLRRKFLQAGEYGVGYQFPNQADSANQLFLVLILTVTIYSLPTVLHQYYSYIQNSADDPEI